MRHSSPTGRALRYFVTGTDTNVGKTRVTAALARAFVHGGEHPTIVKLVQTGLVAGEAGDAHVAARLAGCDAFEFARFARPADPWSAALAEGAAPLDAANLASQLDALREPLIVEGSGGVAVPLNATESIADVAALARCTTIVVVALRLGCINHARLTLDYLAARGVPIRAIVFVDRDGAADDAYRADVARALEGRGQFVGPISYDVDVRRGTSDAAVVLAPLVPSRRDARS